MLIYSFAIEYTGLKKDFTELVVCGIQKLKRTCQTVTRATTDEK